MKTINFKALFITLVTLVMSVTTQVWATDVTTPENLPGYYSGADGQSGSDLWSAVQTLAAKGYTSGLSYSGLWTAYGKADLYPADSVDKAGKIWDMYSTCVFTYQTDQDNGSQSNPPECTCYNREHSIPKSWFGSSTSSGTPGTDMFHVVPTDKVVNAARSNYAFGEVNVADYTSENGGAKRGTPKAISIDNSILGVSSVSTTCGSTPVFEPVDQYKGDFARGYMGTLLHWAGVTITDANFYGKFNSGDGGQIFGDTYTADGNWGLTNYGVALLLKWHRQDPVSQKEIDRNNGIQETQGNRNPFIDYPELAEYIWGSHKGEAFPLATAIATFKDEYNPETGKMDGTGGGTGGDPTCTKLATPAVTAVASNQKITLTWESVTGASSYVVSVGLGLYTTECTEATIGAITTSGTTNTCVITGLTNGTTYTTTVYAVASDDQCNSDADVDTATPFVLEGLSALKTAADGTHEVILTNAVVTYAKDNKIAYVQDALAGLYIYLSDESFQLSAGNIINGLVTVTTTDYNGLTEATAFDYSAATITSGGSVSPAVVSIADLMTAANYGTYESVLVKIEGATVTSAFSSKNATITQDGNSITLRDQNKTATIEATEGKTVNVTGWLSDYNGNKQFQIWYQEQIEEVSTTSYVVTWSINGTEEADAAVEAGTALTLPADPDACDDGKVFMGWTDDANFSGTDEQIAAIFTEAGNKTVDADITYYAVFAKATVTPGVTAADAGTTLWSEDFSGFSNGDVPDKANDKTVVYGSADVTYSCKESGTKVYTGTMSAGGEEPELLIAKGSGAFTATGIPTGRATAMTFTFGTNKTASVITVTTTTEGISINNYSVSNKVATCEITAEAGVSTFDLTITNTAGSSGQNSREDNFLLVVATAGESTAAITTYSEYTLECGAVTPCTLSEITLNTAGVKTDYLTGETFSADGLVVTAVYTGSCSEAEATVTGWTVGAPDMSTAGTQTITVSYTENGITKLATFDITVVAPLENLLALKDAGAGTYYVDLDDAISTYYGTVNNKNIAFIQDATSGLYVYDVATEEIFKKGNIINGVVKVTTTYYNGLIEATAFDKLSATVTEGGTVTEKAVTIAELNSGEYNEYESVLVKISGAMVKTEFTSRNATITQNDNDLVLRDQNSAGTITATVDDVVNVTGWLSRYTKNNVSTLQFQIFEQSQIEVVPDVTYTITVTQPTAGATIAADASTAAEDAVITLSCNLFDGYQLDAWVVKTEGGDAVTVTNNQFTMPAANVTVTATVSLKTYTLTFHVAGNTYVTSQPLPYGTPFSDIIATAMAQYGFEKKNGKYVLTRADSIFTLTGWKEVTELPTIVDGQVTEFTAIISAVAQQYKLTYKVDDEVYGEVETINCGATITPRVAPTKEGYTFSGWDNVPAKMPAQDVTVSGTFSINTYTITYKVEGENDVVQPYEYNAAVQAYTPNDREGYTFSGWDVQEPSVMPAENLVLTGSFTVNKYKITWVVNGVETNEQVAWGTKPVYNGTPSKPEDDTYIYIFKGWSPEVVVVSGEATYTAQFEAQEKSTVQYATITWIIRDGVESVVEQHAHGETLNGPVVENYQTTEMVYTFTGWSPALEVVSGDKTYTAQFKEEARKYEITFVVDNKSYSQELPYGTKYSDILAVAMQQLGFVEDNGQYQFQDATNIYTFTGWVEVTELPEIVTSAATYTLTYTTEPKTPAGWESVEQERPAIKVVENGIMYIIRDGKKYSAQGRLIE